jgi:hypothetical protein
VSVQRFATGAEIALMGDMQHSTSADPLKAFIATHPLDPEDASMIARITPAGRTQKGASWRIDARQQFDALMESVPPPDDVTFESATVGDIQGFWVILRQVDLARRCCMCMAGGSTREAPGHIGTLSGTSPRGRTRGRLCPTIAWLPSILFLQPLTMCWPPSAGWTTAGYAGLPSPETLLEEISRWYLRRA